MGDVLKRLNKVRHPLLQVALDFTRLEDALKLAKDLASLGVDVIEVGTPLIKSEGLRAISLIKSVSPQNIVLADMKTADVGELETEMAWKAGAAASTVLASSDDEVVKSALDKGREVGIDVIVDTVGVRDVKKRVAEVIKLGANIINIHVGIDVQKLRGLTAADVAANYADLIRDYPQVNFSISGGVKLNDSEKLSRLGFKLVIVGSAITKSTNPVDTANSFLKQLRKVD